LFLLIAYGLLWAGYTWWLGAMFDPPWLYVGAGVAAFLVGGCLGALYSAKVAYREWSLVAAARHGLPWSDGRWTAVCGEIHPVAEPVAAPFSGEACVLCEYDVESRGSSASSGEGHPGSDFTGFLMNPCVIRSATGEMRLLGFPNLVGFGEMACDGETGAARARRFFADSPVEDISGLKLVNVFSQIKAAWTDDDGYVRKNLKLTRKSAAEVFSIGEAAHPRGGLLEDDEEPFDEGEITDESDDSDLEDDLDEDSDLEDDDFDDDDWPSGGPLLKERRVRVGEQVCAIGIYSGGRGGLVPGGLGADHFIKLIRGEPEKIAAKSRASVFGHVFGGIVGLSVLHLIAIGVMAAAKYDPEQQRERQEEAFEIVRSDRPNLARLEKLLSRGVDINSIDGQRRTLLGAAKQPAAIEWLKERGASEAPVLEQLEP
jgi:hypothetical protein